MKPFSVLATLTYAATEVSGAALSKAQEVLHNVTSINSSEDNDSASYDQLSRDQIILIALGGTTALFMCYALITAIKNTCTQKCGSGEQKELLTTDGTCMSFWGEAWNDACLLAAHVVTYPARCAYNKACGSP